jgi:nitrate reductase gamma subunit
MTLSSKQMPEKPGLRAVKTAANVGSILLLLGLSGVYDVAIFFKALMAAHDHYSKNNSSDHSVESALTVLGWAIGGQLLFAGVLLLGRRYAQAGIVALGALPLIGLAAVLYLPFQGALNW